MELTKEKALELHRQMWTDMQEAFGDKPSARNRVAFKEDWCDEHFPCEHITHCCFLCEYTCQFSEDGAEDCSRCPVVWPCEPSYWKDDYFCEGNENDDVENGYRFIPISKLLSLPEREDSE
jgi:hypothetical protein